MNVFLPVGNMKKTLPELVSMLGLVAISLLTAACASESGTPVLSASAGADGKIVQTEKLICHSEKRTGTSFSIKICKTAEQWNEVNRNQQRDAYDYTRQVFENGAVTNAKNNGQCGSCNMKD